MKNIITFILILIFIGCTKERVVNDVVKAQASGKLSGIIICGCDAVEPFQIHVTANNGTTIMYLGYGKYTEILNSK